VLNRDAIKKSDRPPNAIAEPRTPIAVYPHRTSKGDSEWSMITCLCSPWKIIGEKDGCIGSENAAERECKKISGLPCLALSAVQIVQDMQDDSKVSRGTRVAQGRMRVFYFFAIVKNRVTWPAVSGCSLPPINSPSQLHWSK
jgi:hypothetical protein